MREFRQFLETELFAAPLELISTMASERQLWDWYAQAPRQGDLRHFLEMVEDCAWHRWARGPGCLCPMAPTPLPGGRLVFPAASRNARTGQPEALDLDSIAEDPSHAWLDDQAGPLHPSQGETLPDADKAGGYTCEQGPAPGRARTGNRRHCPPIGRRPSR